jgi:hypothetical protein
MLNRRPNLSVRIDNVASLSVFNLEIAASIFASA